MAPDSYLVRFRDRVSELSKSKAERNREQLAPYRELHQNAQSAQRRFEFVVLADLVIFGQFSYMTPYRNSSIAALALCLVFARWHIDTLDVVTTAYREMFIRIETETSGPTIIEYIDGSPIELLDDLIYRSNSLAYLLLFFPILYLAIVTYFETSPAFPAIIPALGPVRTAYVYMALLAVAFSSIAYYLYRPSTRLSLTIDPEPRFIGDRVILFFKQNEDRIDRYAELVSTAATELAASLLGSLVLLIGISLLSEGNIRGLAVTFIGLTLFWPSRRLLSILINIRFDSFDAFAGVAVSTGALTVVAWILDMLTLRPAVGGLIRTITAIVFIALAVWGTRRVRNRWDFVEPSTEHDPS